MLLDNSHFYYGYYMTEMLVLIGAIVCIIASVVVKSTYKKYAKISNARRITGAQAAEEILYSQGIRDVRIEYIRGNLTDHYDSKNKVLRLSDATYNSTSVAALGVAAHECGHAIQDQQNYMPLRMRHVLLPAANIGSRYGLPIVFFSLIFGLGTVFMNIGIIVFSFAVLFQLVTLPVEFDASKRAINVLETRGMCRSEELKMCKKVLSAAAMTYVAAAASSILQLLRLVILRNRSD